MPRFPGLAKSCEEHGLFRETAHWLSYGTAVPGPGGGGGLETWTTGGRIWSIAACRYGPPTRTRCLPVSGARQIDKTAGCPFAWQHRPRFGRHVATPRTVRGVAKLSPAPANIASRIYAGRNTGRSWLSMPNRFGRGLKVIKAVPGSISSTPSAFANTESSATRRACRQEDWRQGRP